ncbi:MAG: glycosyltransferase family 2 protein [Gammaproteobacteria bacterium]|nr:glycosyltransferase family 2 protein [Gammaproteobacteria bacterium]
MTENVSVMIFTLNEEIHIEACMDSLAWCDDVIIIDSFSSDKTEVLAKARGARVFKRKFDGFGTQRNWALEQVEIKNDWVLILDADERVTDELQNEIKLVAAMENNTVGGYRVKRRFHMWGKWLKYSSLYPTWVLRLIHKDKVRYINRGHAETQTVAGAIGELRFDLIDENKKGIDEWFERQNRYSRKEADFEIHEGEKIHSLLGIFSRDPLKRRQVLKSVSWRLPGRPIIYFLYSYIFRLGFMDGKAGFMFCLMKAIYQYMIVIKKYDQKQQSSSLKAIPYESLK